MECPAPEALIEVMASERGALLDHAAGCVGCHAALRLLEVIPDGVPPRSHPGPGDQVGRYLVDRVIGQGAMGVVLAARDLALDREVAIKVLHASASPARLQREAQALARLAHPNVVRVYDVGEHDGSAFVAMELVAGVTLRQWLKVPHPIDDVLQVLVQAGRGLVAAHAAGLVHRDVKPDNLFVAGDGRVLVGDFGLAQVGDRGGDGEPALGVAASTGAGLLLTQTGAAVGTPAYMAPEQLEGEATAASDQYSFCVTAWEACFGQRPFGGDAVATLRANQLAGRVERPAEAVVPRRIEDALRRGLAAHPTARFPSMAALLHALAPAPRRRWPVVLAWVAALSAGAVVAGALLVAWRAPVGVAGTSVDASAPMVHADVAAACARAGDEFATSWNADISDQLNVRMSTLVGTMGRYAASWQQARVEACRATRERHEQSEAWLAEQRACLDGARARFDAELAHGVAGERCEYASLPQLEPCDLAVASGEIAVWPPDEVPPDPIGRGCPYSHVNGACTSVCQARGFRFARPVPGVNRADRQEAVVGVAGDGETMLYLAIPARGPVHLMLARWAGTTFVPVDLTPAVTAAGLRVFEGCCTLAADGEGIILARADRRGFVEGRLGGRGRLTVTPLTDALVPAGQPRHQANFPVLSADGRHLIYTAYELSQGTWPVTHEAVRTDLQAAFGPGQPIERARMFEYATGLSADGLTLFMASEFTTKVLSRDRIDQPFGTAASSAASLPGWRAMPTADCRRLATTATPGGFLGEDIVWLEAFDR